MREMLKQIRNTGALRRTQKFTTTDAVKSKGLTRNARHPQLSKLRPDKMSDEDFEKHSYLPIYPLYTDACVVEITVRVDLQPDCNILSTNGSYLSSSPWYIVCIFFIFVLILSCFCVRFLFYCTPLAIHCRA